MAITEPRGSELKDLEERAADHLEKGDVPEIEEEVVDRLPSVDLSVPAGRLGVVVGFSTLAAAMMVGGIFIGVSPRIYAGLAGAAGIAAAVWVRRFRNPILMNVLMALSVFMIGILLNVFKGNLSQLLSPGAFIAEAVDEGNLQQPPVQFSLGWGLIQAWLMAGIGFAAAWVSVELRRPALGMMIPLPIVALAAISVPDDQKVWSGLACLALFAIGLGMLSGVQMGPDEEQRSLAFELRRAARALPLIGAISVGLFFLAQTNFLFPEPLFDPTQSAQKPKTVPLTEVPDRVLFTVDAKITGPWRMGSLDVYDGVDGHWKLPPFAENRLEAAPEDGVLDRELQAGVAAVFTTRGLDGAVLPGLPNMVGIIAQGPFLSYDQRTGNIRLSQGTMPEGLSYTVTAARIPNLDELRQVRFDSLAPEIVPGVSTESFLEIPDPPPAVADLIRRSPRETKWDQLDFMRTEFLATVVAEGQGTPVPITPDDVQDMIAGSKRGSPYQIVAAQAMLARWIGIPSRIGYGYDGGDEVAGVLEVRPKHGASFLEVYFPTYKWLPIIGNPQQSVSSTGQQTQDDRNVLASDDIAVQLFVPFETDPRSFLFQQIREAVLIVLPFFIIGALLYFTWPILRKAMLRSRRRTWARQQGDAARVALAYAEWRDLCTDFGYRHDGDTPLMFLDRVVADDEHTELAWLVTRTLWGTCRTSCPPTTLWRPRNCRVLCASG
jgi:hypothetical protein